MLTLTRDDVDRTLQRGLVPVYAFAVAAGIGATIWAPPSMLEALGQTASRVWGLYMLGGGLVCLVGVLMRRGARGDWLGEFVGIPLVAGAVGVFGVIAASTLDGTPGRMAGICLLGMLTSLLVVRWFRVRDDGYKATGAPPSKAGTLLRKTGRTRPLPPTPPRA